MYLGGNWKQNTFTQKLKLKERTKIEKWVLTEEEVEASSPLKYTDAFAVKQR